VIQGSRKSRILSGISANVFGQVVTATVQLAGVPLLLSCWGAQKYGEWLLLFTLPAYLGLSDLGLGTVATTEVSMCVARQDFEQAQRVFRAAFFFVMAIGLTICLSFSALAWVLPWHRWLNIQMATETEISVVLTLLTWYVFCAIFLTLLLGAYRSIGRYAQGQVTSNVFRLLEFSALLSAVALGGGLVEAAAAFLSVRVLYAGFVWFDIRRRAKWLRLGKLVWEWPLVRALLPHSFSMMTVYVGHNFVAQGLLTIVGLTLGATQVVVFSTVRTLCNFAKQVVGIINLSVFSEYSISLANQDLAAMRRLHTRSVQAIVGLTLVSVIGLKVLGPFIMEFWTKGKVAAEEPFFTLYLCYIFVNSLWLGSWSMLLGCNKHQSITRYYALASIGVLAVGYAGAPTFGLGLMPVAMMSADLMLAFLVLRRGLEVLEQPVEEFFRSIFTFPKLNWRKVEQS
jgi:O-antigen/teichoic acid export membrane protein